MLRIGKELRDESGIRKIKESLGFHYLELVTKGKDVVGKRIF